MKIGIKDIEYIATLSRIELNDREKEMYVQQIDDILSYIEKLNKLNTENVKPVTHTVDINNIFREDKLETSTPSEAVLLNAPSKMGVFFKVPKVIE